MVLEDVDGTRMDGIYFGDGEAFFEELKGKKEIDIIYYPDINEYGGRESLQVVITGYKIKIYSKESLFIVYFQKR